MDERKVYVTYTILETFALGDCGLPNDCPDEELMVAANALATKTVQDIGEATGIIVNDIELEIVGG